MFARVQIKNGNILLLLSRLSFSSSTKESQKFILRRNFPALVACKTSKFVSDKRNFVIIAADSVAVDEVTNSPMSDIILVK